MFSIINKPSGATMVLEHHGAREKPHGITPAKSPTHSSLTAVTRRNSAWEIRPQDLRAGGRLGLATPACQHISTPAYKQLCAKEPVNQPRIWAPTQGTVERNIQIMW